MKHCAWIVLLLLCLAGCRPHGKHFDVDRSRYPVKGIDVSAHNGLIDFGQVAADSVAFVYMKATEGIDFCDAMFQRNHEAATEAGLRVGAYHFFRFKSPGHLQAYHFLSMIGDHAIDLPLVIDVEDWKNDEGIPDGEVAEQLWSMVQVLSSNGFDVMIYTNKQGYRRYVEDLPEAVPLWISSLSGRSPEGEWTLWQHSHAGRVKGVPSLVDIDTYNGTLADFEAWAAGAATENLQPNSNTSIQ